MSKIPKADYDSPWKEAITLHFPSFLEFFFPHIWLDIDWSKGYQLLDKELQRIVRGAAHGRRQVDALVRVTRLSGLEQWVLIHLEVQSQVDPDFGRRMALYHARIRDRYGRDVCSLAILGDEDRKWRPRSYTSQLWGCQQKLSFLMKKLLDFPKKARNRHNPFSWLVAAHRQAQATRRNPLQRKTIKFRMVRGLFRDSGLSREQIWDFFHLVDWVLALPEDLEYDFRDELASFSEEQPMVYVNSFERMTLKKGRAEGRAEGLAEAVLQVVQTRWGINEPELSQKLQGIHDAERLSQLLQWAVTACTPEEWKQKLG